ncbi:MAG: acyl-CoA dehydrogenase [Pseudomonadota bacterium]
MRLRRELEYQLFDVFGMDDLFKTSHYADHDRNTIVGALETAEKLAEEKFAPFAAKLDANEPTFDGEKVHLIEEVQEAVDAYVAAGFMGAGFDYDDGGMQMPVIACQAILSFFCAANLPAAGYPFLTIGAANLERVHASEEQKKLFMRPMIEGRFFGTMCLSEPEAGSSLADIRTKAEPQDDGTYRITGSKMWISAGDHELSENIVHHVLAKIPGGPPGVKGISLFIVPKYLLDEAGAPTQRNDVKLAGLNHKMGYRGTTNTLLNFGEEGGAVGYLVGEPHRGLAYMFQMMNEARIGVGMGAAALGLAGYYASLQYAKDRTQGRALSDKDPQSPPVPIIEHADVKRMLLLQKVYSEGAMSLILYCASLVDLHETAQTGEEKREITRLLDLLTPVAKSYPSEYCVQANSLAIQVHGGYGYTRDFPVERHYRDNRLNPIHEGTTGIQGLDLLGRKVLGDGGEALTRFMGLVGETTAAAKANPRLQQHAEALEQSAALIGDITKALGEAALKEGPERALANATLYLDVFGQYVIGWIWLRQALTALRLLGAGGGDEDYLNGKLAACDFFFRWELPKIGPQALLLRNLDPATLETEGDWL